jgi:hypothetical protein
MNIQKVPLSHGGLWIQHGWRLMMRNPSMVWLLAMLGTLGVYLALQIPVMGVFLGIGLMPVLMAGYMRACRALEYSERVDINHLFAGFEQRTRPLIALGGWFMLGMMLISLCITLLGGAALKVVLDSFQGSTDPTLLIDALMAAGGTVLLSLLVGCLLCFALVFALQYAPMLVLFDQMSPQAALKASLQGTLANLVPFTLYSVLLQVLGALLSFLPYSMGWLIILPLGLTSIYVSYRDIFESASVATDPVIHE